MKSGGGSGDSSSGNELSPVGRVCVGVCVLRRFNLASEPT